MNNLLSINSPKKKKHIDGQRSFKSTSYKFINLQQTVVYVGQRTFVTSLYIIGKGCFSLRTCSELLWRQNSPEEIEEHYFRVVLGKTGSLGNFNA